MRIHECGGGGANRSIPSSAAAAGKMEQMAVWPEVVVTKAAARMTVMVVAPSLFAGDAADGEVEVDAGIKRESFDTAGRSDRVVAQHCEYRRPDG